MNFHHAAEPAADLRDVVWGLVTGGADVRDGVRRAAVRALARSRLGLDEIHAVIEPVLGGASDALQPEAEESRRAFAEAVDGLDDALSGAVQAMLQAGLEARALDEAGAGSALRRLVADLRSLEALLIESLEEARRVAAAEAGPLFDTLAGELRRSGTETGRLADHATARIEAPLRRAPHRRPTEWPVRHAPQPQLGRQASRILAGLADALELPQHPPVA